MKKPAKAKISLADLHQRFKRKMTEQVGRLRCDFCGKTQDEVEVLIAGPSNFICNVCSDICLEIIDERGAQTRKEQVLALCVLTYQYATKSLTEDERATQIDLIHETANKIRSRMRERKGDQVAGYTLVRAIGSGNFATVWEGHKRGDNPERAAIKIFDQGKLALGLMLWRFQRGIRAMQHLASMSKLAPNSVVRIFDVSDDGLAFSMQYLPGGDLQNINRFGWSRKKKLQVFKSVCQAVQFAHSQGIIHRDIKPANVVLTDAHQPVLTDFDIAEIKFAATESVRSGSLGTPQFAAPEQLVGTKIDVAVTADIYSLGKLLYFLMTEESPPLGSAELESMPGYLKKIQEGSIRQAIYKAIQHEPSNRFQTIEQLLGQFEDIEPPTAVTPLTDDRSHSKGGENQRIAASSEHANELQPHKEMEVSRYEGRNGHTEENENQIQLESSEFKQEAASVTKWLPLLGAVFGGISLLFFMMLVVAGIGGYSVPPDSKFLVINVLSIGTSLSVSFLGGSAAASGTLPLPYAQIHPIKFAASGGLAAFVITMVLGYLFYVR